MSEPTLSEKTEALMKDTFNSISPVLMEPINNSLTQFINNTLRFIDKKKAYVKQEVSIKAHKYASYVGKSIKSIIGDFPPFDAVMTVKSFSQLGVFMISEINNILFVASLTNLFPKVELPTHLLKPVLGPVLNLDVTIIGSLNKTRDTMNEKTQFNIRNEFQKGLKGDQRKIEVLMDIIFVPFITIFLTELFKIVFADFKIPVGSPGAEPYQSPSTQQRRLGGGATRKTSKQKKRLITKYRKSKNNKLRTRSRASRSHNQRH
jgi:hypothetical protein